MNRSAPMSISINVTYNQCSASPQVLVLLVLVHHYVSFFSVVLRHQQLHVSVYYQHVDVGYIVLLQVLGVLLVVLDLLIHSTNEKEVVVEQVWMGWVLVWLECQIAIQMGKE